MIFGQPLSLDVSTCPVYHKSSIIECNMSRDMRKAAFRIRQNKVIFSCMATAHRTAHKRLSFRYFLHLKFQACNYLLWLYSRVCVRLGWKP